jgi:hypothetical protein
MTERVTIDRTEAGDLAEYLTALRWVLEHGSLTDATVEAWEGASAPGGVMSALRYGGSHGRLLVRENVERAERSLRDAIAVAHLDDSDFGGDDGSR